MSQARLAPQEGQNLNDHTPKTASNATSDYAEPIPRAEKYSSIYGQRKSDPNIGMNTNQDRPRGRGLQKSSNFIDIIDNNEHNNTTNTKNYDLIKKPSLSNSRSQSRTLSKNSSSLDPNLAHPETFPLSKTRYKFYPPNPSHPNPNEILNMQSDTYRIVARNEAESIERNQNIANDNANANNTDNADQLTSGRGGKLNSDYINTSRCSNRFTTFGEGQYREGLGSGGIRRKQRIGGKEGWVGDSIEIVKKIRNLNKNVY